MSINTAAPISVSFRGMYYNKPNAGWVDLSSSDKDQKQKLSAILNDTALTKGYVLLSGTLDGEPKTTFTNEPILLTGKQWSAIPANFRNDCSIKQADKDNFNALLTYWFGREFSFTKLTKCTKNTFMELAGLNQTE